MKVGIFVFCAQVCFIQSVFSLGCSNIAGQGIAGFNQAGPGIAYDGPNPGCGGVASTGGSFAVNSASSLPPTGLNIVSENLYEGGLIVEGNLPLLGSVGLEGAMGTAGAGAVSYGCGDGDTGIAVEEGPIVTGILAPGPVGPGVSGSVLGSGLAGSIGSGLAGKASAPGLAFGSGLGYNNGLLSAGKRPGCGCGYGAINNKKY